MKILVLSDSHSGMSLMRRCVRSVKPDVLIHLGDYYEDAKTLSTEFPDIPMYHVPGNCDRYQVPDYVEKTISCRIDGVSFYMTHGHLHGVKMETDTLLADARRHHAQAVLYGHTHIADCRQETDGLWVLNPGSCGGYNGTAGLILTENQQIKGCWILHGKDIR